MTLSFKTEKEVKKGVDAVDGLYNGGLAHLYGLYIIKGKTQ